jgi:hypothetical protein
LRHFKQASTLSLLKTTAAEDNKSRNNFHFKKRLLKGEGRPSAGLPLVRAPIVTRTKGLVGSGVEEFGG